MLDSVRSGEGETELPRICENSSSARWPVTSDMLLLVTLVGVPASKPAVTIAGLSKPETGAEPACMKAR